MRLTQQEYDDVVRRMALTAAKPMTELVKPARQPAKPSYNRKLVVEWFASQGIPAPTFEHRFHESRKWRFDICWPLLKLAIEVQGGIWTQGRHTRGAALLKEWEKLNEAACLGWRILFCQPRDLMTTATAQQIIRAMSNT